MLTLTKMRFNIFLVLLAASCTNEVSNPLNIQRLEVVNSSSISLVSNSTLTLNDSSVNNQTIGQALCENQNSVVLRVSLSQNSPLFCRDRSKLNSKLTKGPVCQDGPIISDFTTNVNSVNCRELTICGVSPSSSEDISKRFEGGNVTDFTFTNLPWGCQALLEFSKNNTFNEVDQKLEIYIHPPECPFCINSNKFSCQSDCEIDATRLFVNGNIITKCTENCSTCPTSTFPPRFASNTPTSVAHGESLPFYLQERGNCLTKKKCSELRDDRVCDIGKFAGDTSYQYLQCTDEVCGCNLPKESFGEAASMVNYRSGTKFFINKRNQGSCQDFCTTSKLEIECRNGDWFKASQSVAMNDNDFEGYAHTDCVDPLTCDCPRSDRVTVTDQTTKDVFTKNQVSCDETCNNVRGQVSCSYGILRPTNPAINTLLSPYNYDQCAQENCGCRVELDGGEVRLLDNNTSTSLQLHKYKENTLANLDLCTNPLNSIVVKCINGVLSSTDLAKPYNKSTYKYPLCTTKTFGCTYTGATPAITVNHNAPLSVFPTNAPACLQSCLPKLLQCRNGTFFDLSTNMAITANLLSTHRYTTCNTKDCSCKINGFTLQHNQNKDFYKVGSGSCSLTSCDDKENFTCNDTVIQNSNSKSPNDYTFPTCETSVCNCPLPGGGTLESGKSTKVFKIATTTCDVKDACEEPSNFTEITCSNGTLTPMYNPAFYPNLSCSRPICECTHAGVTIPFGAVASFYSNENPPGLVSCADFMGTFECRSGGNLVGSTNSALKLEDFPYINCESLLDSGTLGGTGGGTGNDEGPGSALRKKTGLLDGGGGGPGLPCMNATGCIDLGVRTHNQHWPKLFCRLPWGDGFIETYGSITAFNQSCINKTANPSDTCQKHRQSRTCTMGAVWTGDESYRFPTCVEKTSCP